MLSEVAALQRPRYEHACRAANDRIYAVAARMALLEQATAFVCECGQHACDVGVHLTAR
jgi:hypothetical protein